MVLYRMWIHNQLPHNYTKPCGVQASPDWWFHLWILPNFLSNQECSEVSQTQKASCREEQSLGGVVQPLTYVHCNNCWIWLFKDIKLPSFCQTHANLLLSLGGFMITVNHRHRWAHHHHCVMFEFLSFHYSKPSSLVKFQVLVMSHLSQDIG